MTGISDTLNELWNGIASLWEVGLGNATLTIFDPKTGQLVNDPLSGTRNPWINIAKLSLIGVKIPNLKILNLQLLFLSQMILKLIWKMKI